LPADQIANQSYVERRLAKNGGILAVHSLPRLCWVIWQKEVNADSKAEGEKQELPCARRMEALRQLGCQLYKALRTEEVGTVLLEGDAETDEVLALVEGLGLAAYRFLTYLKTPEKPAVDLKEIQIGIPGVRQKEVDELSVLWEAVYTARDWVNEPQSYLTALQFAEEVQLWAKQTGFKAEIFHKKQIESLKMGGILAVNKGSVQPPVFMVLEWKPKKAKGSGAKSQKPIVLVGKGVVYDTGGLSLKPTPGSMDSMKCDMAGAAVVAATLGAAARMQLPVHLVGLIPATDNRPSGEAYAPGDVISISDGTTVEVLNTDAEGRLILADALHYAKKFEPQLVVDLATLTGSAVLAIGLQGAVVMGTAGSDTLEDLAKSGLAVHERLVHFPLWDEYGEMLKSHVADLKNIGGREAGAITAGKFLQHFTNYPWVHIDIAGPAFLDGESSYRGKHGTGFGVRLLLHFLKNRQNER
jgi:leucyl aminopeptidase